MQGVRHLPWAILITIELMLQPRRPLLVLLLLITVAGSVYFLREPSIEKTAQSAVALRPAPRPVPETDEFGIRKDQPRTEHLVRRGQTFSDILGEHGISAARVHEIVGATGEAIDVRRIRPGDRFFIYGGDSTAQHLVYQPNPVDYVVVDLRGSVRVSSGERPIEITRKTISGVIEGSLYGEMLEQGGNPALVDRIANDIYAWTIDFQHLQRGDAFTVVYEEKSVDGEFYEIGDIVAVRFDHADEPHYAYRFEDEGGFGYFDENGNSLRKALLMSPLRYSAITSGYSKRRFHPVQKRYKAHLGTDYAAPQGTPIWTVGDGVVVEAQYKRYNGNYVKIRHNSTYTTQYLHMSRIAKGIKPGVRVRQGETIGYVGSTGLATGPHVCYRFWKNGVQVDSRKEVLPPSDPVDAAQRASFASLMDSLRPQLDRAAGAPYLASDVPKESSF